MMKVVLEIVKISFVFIIAFILGCLFTAKFNLPFPYPNQEVVDLYWMDLLIIIDIGAVCGILIVGCFALKSLLSIWK